MADQPPRPPSLLKAASEPDLTALPTTPVPSEPLPPPPPFPAPPPLVLPPPSPTLSPRSSPRGSPRALPPSSPPYLSKEAVSFSEYVASELAGSATLGVSFAPAATTDAQNVAPPAASPPLRSPAASGDDEGGFVPHEPAFSIGSMGRCGKLACLQLDEKGCVEERELTRAEILQEARETFSKSQPSPKAIGRWLSQASSPGPELRQFTSMLEPGGAKNRKATQKALRDYLRNSLQARDIRQVDPAFVAKPALWVRHSALVVSLEGLRAIILYNKMFLFDPGNERTRHLAFIAKQSILARPDAEQEQPFEFRALEGVLIFVAMELEREFEALKPKIEEYFHQLPNELTTKMLEELRLKKQQLNHFHVRASSVKTILENVLDDDEEMANMYLTEKTEMRSYAARSSVDHSEVETMLEAYLQMIDEHVNHSTLLNDAIDDTEDLVMIHLDTLRNRLLSVELALSVVSMTFGIGGVMAGIFGMNIHIPLFDHHASKLWFAFVVVAILAIVCIISWLVLVALRRRGLYSFY